jgi:antitoxin ParD1/3/4
MAKTPLELGAPFDEFIARKVSEGAYGNSGEVVRAGLRLLETRDNELAAIRAALVEGENSGPAALFDFETFIIAGRAGPNR